MRLHLPEKDSRRRLIAGLACSLLLHFSLAALTLWTGIWPSRVVVKRGEPLLIELPPERPEEPPPRGTPATPGPVSEAKPKLAPPQAARPKAKALPRVEARRPATPQPAPVPPPVREPVPAPEPPVVARAAPLPEPEGATLRPVPPTRDAAEAPPVPPAPVLEAPRVADPQPEPDVVAALPREPGAGGSGGAGGLWRGRGGIEGEPIPLDTPDPRYTDYFERVRQRIKSHWIYPREAGERGIGGQLVIAFAIAKAGDLVAIELRRSSGVPILDLYALNAVKLAQPFPPVPDSVTRGVLPIQGIFTYQIVDTRLLNQFLR